MDFLISESQLQIILLEQEKNKFSSDMKRLHSFTTNMVNRVMKNYGLNLKMLLTWGAAVGGLVMPLDVLIKTGNFNLSEKETALVLAGVAFTVFFENKRGIVTLLKKIKDEGLEDEYLEVLTTAQTLKNSFVNFLKSCRITSGAVLDTIAYSFLIPIITDIHSIAVDSSNLNEAALLIAERLIASGVVVLSKDLLSMALKKIIRKFK